MAHCQLLNRNGKFIFQIIARSVLIIFGPIIAQLVHPVFRFWWRFRPVYRWRVKKIYVPGHVSQPSDAIGNGFANRSIAVVKMFNPDIAQGLGGRNSCIKGIFFKNRNPDNGSADICIGIFVKDIRMYRPGTLVSSQRTGG